MNRFGKLTIPQIRASCKGMVLRSIGSTNTYDGRSKPRPINRSIQIQSCSTSTQKRETFDEFRSREEQKEKETLSQSTLNIKEKGQEHDDGAEVETVKDTILKTALGYVATHGWSKQAIVKGAESLNYPCMINGLFPKGGIELLHFFQRHCNERLVVYLKEEITKNENHQDSATFARKAIELRLRMIIPYLQHWPQALGLMALPPNVPTSLANVLTLVDDICYYAGDRSVDFNWYTRRIGLASIYKATELYMLQDTSKDYEKTWRFLERRFEEARILHDFLVKSENATLHIQNALGSTFSTARNILGLNFERR